MFGFLWKLLPEDWRWDVAIKKASYTIGKLGAAALMMGKAKVLVGSHLTPDQLVQVQGAIGAVSAALLEGIHDWAKLKFPDNKYL